MTEQQLDSSAVEEKPGNGSKVAPALKNVIFSLVLLVVIIASFLISFSLGKKLLSPAKKLSEKPAKVEVPAPPASLNTFMKQGQAPVMPKIKKITSTMPRKAVAGRGYYKIVAGVFSSKAKASALSAKLNSNNMPAFVKKSCGQWRVQAGAYKQRSLANKQANALKQQGFSARIIYE
jgi:cell division protein FtsN